MGYLQFGIFILFYGSSLGTAILSRNQTEIERAAELAVERAAERAAERAVEKALNSGNSSTITVTVKESYSNAKKTAEEAAAPGSESTRPHDPQMHDRQYAYTPPGQYDVEESAEAEELGISQESLNSSVEDIGATNEPETEQVADASNESGEFSSEDGKDVSDKPPTSNIDVSTLDVSGDFSGFDVSSEIKGDFGLKSNTKTFSQSYSNPKNGFTGATVDVDDDEGAEILKMYAGDFGGTGWSSAKRQGWIRHKPLWDDTKSRISRSFWDSFGDNVAKGTEVADEKKKNKYRNDEFDKKNNSEEASVEQDKFTMPQDVSTFNSKDIEPDTLMTRNVEKSIKGNKEDDYDTSTASKMLATIPIPSLLPQGFQKNHAAKLINHKLYEPDVTSEKYDDETKEEDDLKMKDSFTEKSEIKGTFIPFKDKTDSRSNYESTTPKPIDFTTKMHRKRLYNAKYLISKSQ